MENIKLQNTLKTNLDKLHNKKHFLITTIKKYKNEITLMEKQLNNLIELENTLIQVDFKVVENLDLLDLDNPKEEIKEIEFKENVLNDAKQEKKEQE